MIEDQAVRLPRAAQLERAEAALRFKQSRSAERNRQAGWELIAVLTNLMTDSPEKLAMREAVEQVGPSEPGQRLQNLATLVTLYLVLHYGCRSVDRSVEWFFLIQRPGSSGSTDGAPSKV